MGPTRVLIIGGSDIVLAGLRVVLDDDSATHVVGTADRGDRGMELIDDLHPDVIVVEDALPDQNAPSLCADALERNHRLAIVLIATEADDSVIWRAFRSGARGFLHVRSSASDLRRAVAVVARGGTALDPRVSARVLNAVHKSALTKLQRLSQREMQVMELVEAGASDRRIAWQLGVSPSTVKTYVRRSLDKLACNTRAEGAAQLARWGRPARWT